VVAGRRLLLTALLLAGLLAASGGAAFAHGVHGEAATTSTGGFVWLGFIHMLAGWDHLLFIAGVVLLAGQVRRAAVMISLFALGHSLTLIVATLAGWRFNPTLVDVVIALSLAFVGVVGWWGRPTRWGWFAAAVFGFGLIHGLGLSTRLQDVGVGDGVAAAVQVIAFNIGVELGQLVAILAIVMLGQIIWRHLSQRLTWQTMWRTVHAGLMIIGLAGGAILATTTANGPNPTAHPAPAITEQVTVTTVSLPPGR
jgi:hydrogenase/urease accessory protein HupE